MKIVKKPLSDLHPIEKNIRRHTEKQLKEYVRSIEMFGQTRPAVVDEDGQILIGNGLFYALQLAGKDSCDCYVMTNLTETQKKKLMLSDNRVYELGFTDTAIFDEIIRDLNGDVDVPGWDADLLEMLNASIREANNMIENYGVASEGEAEAVSNRERVDHSETGASAPSAGAAQPAGEGVPPEAEQRFVICPKCGERICL